MDKAQMDIAIHHLKSKDPILGKAITKVKDFHFPLQDISLYEGLVKSIIGQQLSTKASESIYRRFLNHFHGTTPKPELLINQNDETLRYLGLSKQKAGYVRNVAQFFMTNDEVRPLAIPKGIGSFKPKAKQNTIDGYDDDGLVKLFTQIKGVGEWTVQMNLMFVLGRPDVFSPKDLIIEQMITKLYSIPDGLSKRERFHRIDQIAEKWKPYRTVACLCLWRLNDIGL